MPVSRRVRVLAAAAVAATGAGLVLVGTPGTAQAAAAAPPPAGYAAWTFTGTTTDYAGTLDLGNGFPATTFTTDSRTPPGASAADPSGAIGGGATVWLPAGSLFGAVYGSSQAQPYLSLRPRADNAGSPSTTTYTFDGPTPVGTWAVALGDIDAEILTVTATDATGGPVTGTELGVTAFNYCDASPRSSSCSGQTAPYVLPTVTVTAGAVTAQDPLCPPTDCDTQGASVSVQPAVPLRTLTVTSTWKQGFPAYQTWFATKRATITGAVIAPCALPAPRPCGWSRPQVRCSPPPRPAQTGPTRSTISPPVPTTGWTSTPPIYQRERRPPPRHSPRPSEPSPRPPSP